MLEKYNKNPFLSKNSERSMEFNTGSFIFSRSDSFFMDEHCMKDFEEILRLFEIYRL